MKAIILARVSTKEQEDGQSILAQVRRLTEHADKHQLSLIQVFQITESSTKESRKEFEKIIAMERHVNADESFHVTASMIVSLAQRSREIFESSEVDEKRQLLNFVFQNLELRDKKLSVTLREPFKIIKDTSLLEKCPRICPE